MVMILGKNSTALRILTLIALLFGLAAAGAVHYWTSACPSSCSLTAPPPVRVTEAKPAPSPHVEIAGLSIPLSEIAPGRRVAILVMKGTWCAVCTSQLVRLQERAVEYPRAVVFGLSAQPAVETARVVSELQLAPILSDTDRDAIRSFGLDGPSHPVPGVVFLDETGRVVDVVRGRYPGRPQEDWVIERLNRPW